jgi:hypothetical protein
MGYEKSATYIDIENMDIIRIKKIFRDLTRTPGYCVFVDICNSTKLKDNEIHEWILRIRNTFTWAQTLFPFKALKGIGDELMFYITESYLENLKNENPSFYFTPLQMLQALNEFVINDDYQEPIKCAICYCENVYNITFIENSNDYYGKDIDLAARIMEDSEKDTIIMNKKFFNIIKTEYESISNRENFRDIIENIKELPPQKYKGFEEEIERFLLKCKKR